MASSSTQKPRSKLPVKLKLSRVSTGDLGLATDETSDEEIAPRKVRKRFKKKKKWRVRKECLSSYPNTSTSVPEAEPVAPQNLIGEIPNSSVLEDVEKVSTPVKTEEKPKETLLEEIHALRKIMEGVDMNKIPTESLYLMETQYSHLTTKDEITLCMTTRDFVNLLVRAEDANCETLMNKEDNDQEDC